MSLALVVNLKEELILAGRRDFVYKLTDLFLMLPCTVPFFRRLGPETIISVIRLLESKIAVPDEVSEPRERV